uniref:Putative secreted peptide n=1 Tax=Anopheles braziliensis TaxID=58242 RepID=A0A2M3ZXQ5_9DIPT
MMMMTVMMVATTGTWCTHTHAVGPFFWFLLLSRRRPLVHERTIKLAKQNFKVTALAHSHHRALVHPLPQTG